jgi:hypothetical protein
VDSFNKEEKWEVFSLFKEAIRPFGKAWGIEGAVAPFAEMGFEGE